MISPFQSYRKSASVEETVQSKKVFILRWLKVRSDYGNAVRPKSSRELDLSAQVVLESYCNFAASVTRHGASRFALSHKTLGPIAIAGSALMHSPVASSSCDLNLLQLRWHPPRVTRPIHSAVTLPPTWFGHIDFQPYPRLPSVFRMRIRKPISLTEITRAPVTPRCCKSTSL